MKVLLLYPNLRGMYVMPTAVAIFSALLKQDNHEVRLFDTTYWEFPEDGIINHDKYKAATLQIQPYQKAKKQVPLYTTNVYEDFNKEVAAYEPDLIACSATEDLFPYAMKLLRNLRTKGKAKTILGGLFATFAPEKAIQPPEIDIICLGEGEYPLQELCKRIDKGQSYTDIPNLWVKQDGVVVKNKMTSLTDIDHLPLLDLEIFDESRYYRPFAGKIYRTIPVKTHRGCPYKCAYCNSPAQERLYKTENFVSMSVLNMPQFSKEAIEGVRRCFVPYLFLEEKRWPEIELAEQLTPKGDKIWENLIAECRERFFPSLTQE